MRSPILLVLVCAAPLTAAPVDFARDVRPILSQHCFKCHGPDDATRKGGLRFDLRASAVGEGKSGEISIVPGKPDQSEFVRRLITDDESELMPPPAVKKPLTAAQKATLKQWVAEGAEYRDHWAFLPPKRPVVPAGANAIDHFIAAKLAEKGLKPSPAADKHTLVRRVYLDLIGLPPTPAVAKAFLEDTSPDAYEKLVDQLLKSPHYGERWARRWLDLARYADTNGYEKDRPRIMWPYRDWVIKSLNDDLPFDQFSIKQLAGDLLPNATLQDRVATGFHRNTMLNEEGGADPLEFRWHALNDRVATTGTVWLGLTLNCCQCHHHKFDPVSQAEYFRLAAFLNNCDEPTIEVPSDDIAKKRAEIEAGLAKRERELSNLFPVDPLASPDDERTIIEQRRDFLRARFAAWLKIERERSIAWSVLTPTKSTANIPLLTVEPGGVVFVSGDFSKRDVYDLAFGDVKDINALRIEALPDDRLPGKGPGRVSYEGPFGDFFLCETTLVADGKPVKLVEISSDYADGKNTAPLAADGDPLTGWGINGGQGKPHAIVFNFDQPVSAKELKLSMVFEKYYAAGLGKFRVSVTRDKKAVARAMPHELQAALRHPGPLDLAALGAHFLSIAPELRVHRDDIARARATLPKHPTALVMTERPPHYPRPTHIHHRGEWTEPKETVSPGVPAVLPAISGNDRLAFARWLVSAENPLTARVTANRAWAAFFGRGLVRTTEDFGHQGDLPTHPELLDWLAQDLVASKWSVKSLHKRIVMSATYQQSAVVTPESKEKDPANELLGRGPRLRLDAEVVRDNALKAAGLLSAKVGGPSVFPPQPASVTSDGAYGALKWEASPGEDRFRRGLYTFAKRTAPFAMTATFDGPSGEACLARREVSNTPLQALTLLNDAAFVEAAQAMGKQLAAMPGSTADKAKSLWERCLVRPPTDRESKLLTDFFEARKKQFAEKSDIPALTGDLDVIDRAAWTATARAVLNLDEMVTRD